VVVGAKVVLVVVVVEEVVVPVLVVVVVCWVTADAEIEVKATNSTPMLAASISNLSRL
jgi:hypothetical protein